MADTTRQTGTEARSCLTAALIKLATEKPLSSITVTELCSAAGVSRMSYYRNFDSKEEIIRAHLRDLKEEYRRLTAPLREAGELWYGMGHLTACFAFFKEHSDLMECLFACGLTGELVGTVSSFMLDNWGNGTRESEYLLIAFAGALVSGYGQWALNSFEESPQQMAELMCGFYKVLPTQQA